jgi:dihydroorotate dehydrogenase electron transfer subunit
MLTPEKTRTLAPVVEVRRLTDDIVNLVFGAPEMARRAQPGHFVAVRAGQTEAPLLRRPFSIAANNGQSLTLIFRIIGVGTTLLAAKRPGETLDVIGPLGHPFEIHDDRPVVLVAGGLGIPPVAFLARVLKARGIPATLYYGVRTQTELAMLGDAADYVDRLVVSTDDGSAGHHGVISEVVARAIGDGCRLYGCGPRPLLDVLIQLARERQIPTQLSFEQQMACGVGACMGCSIATARGYQRVCTEGPVFPAEVFFY